MKQDILFSHRFKVFAQLSDPTPLTFQQFEEMATLKDFSVCKDVILSLLLNRSNTLITAEAALPIVFGKLCKRTKTSRGAQ
jgi:hypothetical protein